MIRTDEAYFAGLRDLPYRGGSFPYLLTCWNTSFSHVGEVDPSNCSALCIVSLNFAGNASSRGKEREATQQLSCKEPVWVSAMSYVANEWTRRSMFARLNDRVPN